MNSLIQDIKEQGTIVSMSTLDIGTINMMLKNSDFIQYVIYVNNTKFSKIKESLNSSVHGAIGVFGEKNIRTINAVRYMVDLTVSSGGNTYFFVVKNDITPMVILPYCDNVTLNDCFIIYE